MTTIYHYSDVTGEFVGESTIEKDAQLPANTTTSKPPKAGDKKAVVWHEKEQKWQQTDDFRGTTYWLADGSEHTITKLGEKTPKDALDAAPLTLADHQYEAKRQIRLAIRKQINTLVDKVDEYTVAIWPEKIRRAERIVADNGTEADLLIVQAECDARGRQETPQQLAKKQFDKALRFSAVTAVIDGVRKAAFDAIDTAKDEVSLQKIVTNTINKLEQAETTAPAVTSAQHIANKGLLSKLRKSL